MDFDGSKLFSVCVFLCVSGTIEPSSPIRDVLAWSGSLITHLFILSTRGQCRAANNLALEKIKSKELLKGLWQLNTGPLDGKPDSHSSLKKHSTSNYLHFSIKIDQPFNFFSGGGWSFYRVASNSWSGRRGQWWFPRGQRRQDLDQWSLAVTGATASSGRAAVSLRWGFGVVGCSSSLA